MREKLFCEHDIVIRESSHSKANSHFHLCNSDTELEKESKFLILNEWSEENKPTISLNNSEYVGHLF